MKFVMGCFGSIKRARLPGMPVDKPSWTTAAGTLLHEEDRIAERGNPMSGLLDSGYYKDRRG